MNIEYVKIKELQGYEFNTRTHSDSQVNQLAASIGEFGFTNPLLIDGERQIIAGHGRFAAATKLQMDEVPCIVLDHLSEAQRRAYVIADNKLALNAGWDEDLLKLELSALDKIGFDLSVVGFDEDELSGLVIDEDIAGGLTDEDDVPEVAEIPISKQGDIWLLGEHRVMCGDSTNGGDVALLMNGEKADMVFTDPPYGVDIKGKFTGTILNDNLQGDEFINFLTSCFENLNQYNNGNLYISYEIKNQTLFEKALENCGFKFDEIIIWNKDSASFYSKNKYNRKYEPIFFIENGKELKCEPDVNVWDFAKSSSFASRDENNKRFNEKGNFLVAHPTTKPIGLISKALNNSTSLNNLTLDLFLGSGSTLIASEKKGRKCYGMELDPKYVDVIIKRWQDYTGKKAIHAESGVCFNEVADAKQVA